MSAPPSSSLMRSNIIAAGLLDRPGPGDAAGQERRWRPLTPQFPGYLARLLGHPLTTGDAYIVHTNGDEAFPAMLRRDRARAASRELRDLHLRHAGRSPARFTDAFVAAARRGVDVRMVLDALGAKTMDPTILERLEQAGCHIGWYQPGAPATSLEEANYRTHRKALVSTATSPSSAASASPISGPRT